MPFRAVRRASKQQVKPGTAGTAPAGNGPAGKDRSRTGRAAGGLREVVGAAARYVERRLGVRQTSEPDSAWQRKAWELYDQTPEVRFAAGWIGAGMSRATLYAGKRAPDGTVEAAPDNHPAAVEVASIAGGPAGQAEMLGDFGPHLVVAGEASLVVRPKVDDTGQVTNVEWWVLSVLEITQQAGGLQAEINGELVPIPTPDPDNPDDDTDENAPLAIRVWDPHPRRYIEADSPIRSSLTLLEELRLLNAAVAAIARSRLTGRGVLLVPQGTRFPTAPGQEHEDDLLDVFMSVAETAYREPDSAAAAVPIILEVPADAIPHIQKITFESEFDELAIKLREETIRRFATGLDTPAEVLLGLSSASHWNSWQIEESAIKMAIEPRLATVCHALTEQWLRPRLHDLGVPDADEWVVWYDTTALRRRVNRPQTAIDVFREGAIGPQALRRETGFDDDDAPDPANEERDLLIRLVQGAPSLAPLILPLLGIELPDAATSGDTPGGGTDADPPPAPQLPVDEAPGPPDTDELEV